VCKTQRKVGKRVGGGVPWEQVWGAVRHFGIQSLDAEGAWKERIVDNINTITLAALAAVAPCSTVLFQHLSCVSRGACWLLLLQSPNVCINRRGCGVLELDDTHHPPSLRRSRQHAFSRVSPRRVRTEGQSPFAGCQPRTSVLTVLQCKLAYQHCSFGCLCIAV